MAALQKQMVATGKLNVVENIRNANMRALANTGAFRVEAIKSTSAVENYTKALQKQDVTFRNWRKNAELRNKVLKEQHRIQRMSAVGWSEDGNGRISADMVIPREAPERLNSFKRSMGDVLRQQATFSQVLGETRMRLGLWNQGVQSASRNMINWGKNTQWAGRQMMVGLTIPMAAFATASGMLAYQVDQEMTRVLKVYDYATTNLEAEGERIKDISMGTAQAMSAAYGQSAKDTIGIIGDLAATGKTGMELQGAAQVVSRASMLGELDRQDAIKTTISLQTVFNQNTQELAQTFDYLNALENSTSLSMRDMTIAIPKLAGVVQALGGDYKDMGLMMTAARSSGLEAAEAANMLKTVMFRAVSPYGKGAKTFAAATGVDLEALVKQTNGEAIPTFQKMAEAIDAAGLSRPEKTAVFKDVFGVYQGSKALQFITELGEMNDKSSQTYAAAQVGMKNATELAGIAAQEVARLQSSASGRFKIALETIKTEMAALGEPFLKVATTFLGAITSIIKRFNDLSDGSKGVIFTMLGFAAVLGPLTMVTGVMVTLAGTFIKMAAVLLSLGSRYKAVSADQFAQNLLAKQGTLAFHDQATAARLLSIQLAQINAQLTTMTGKNAAAAGSATRAAATMTNPLATPIVAGAGTGTIPVATTAAFGRAATRPPVVVTPGVSARPAGYLAGRRWDRENPGADRAGTPAVTRPVAPPTGQGAKIAAEAQAVATAAKAQAAATADVADNANKAARGFQSMNGSLMASAGTVAVLAGGTNKFINSIGIALLATTAILPILQKIAATKTFTNMGKSISGMSTNMKGFANLSSGVRASLLALGPALGPLGMALAAAGAAFGFMFFKLKQARKEAQELNNAGESIITSVGGVPLTEGEYMKNESTNVQADLFKKNDKDSYEALAKLGDKMRETGKEADKLTVKRRVLQIGLETFDATGDATKAKQAIDVALAAAGLTRADVPVSLSFDDSSMMHVRQELSNALVDAAAENKGKWFDPGMSNQVQEDLKAEAKRLSQMFGQVQAGMISTTAFAKELDRVKQTFVAKGTETAEAYMGTFSKIEKRIFKEEGVDVKDVREVGEALVTNQKLVDRLKHASPSGAGSRAAVSVQNEAEAYRYLSSQLAGKMKIDNSAKISAKDLGTFHEILDDSARKAAGGLNKAGGAAGAEAGQLDEAAEAAQAAATAMSELQRSTQEEVMTTVTDGIFERAAQEFEDQHEATIENMEAASQRRLDSIEEEQERRNRDFENRGKGQEKRHRGEDKALELSQKNQTKAVEASYDARVKAIETTMEAEAKAEAMRERMFEAERTRISRLAEMYNTNVDFNVALNSGDLDEAAKLSNNMRATEQQWGIDDAQIGAGDAAEQRREQQQTEIEKINEAKEARMEALQIEQDRAKELLAERQASEKQALEDEKKRYADSVASRRKAEETKTRDAVNASNKRFQAEKKALDMELAALKAFIPQNQAQLAQHIANIEAQYNSHGGNLNTKSAEWSNYVARAINAATVTAQAKLTNDINWGKIGKDVGDEVARGMLGMNFTQFIEWMTTGKLPPAPKPATAAAGAADPRRQAIEDSRAPGRTAAAQAAAAAQRNRNIPVRHGGGPLDGNFNNRAGRPMTANLYSDEVPAILQKGEFVFQKSAVKKYGVQNLLKMNNGDIGPDHTGRMHEGGMVDALGMMTRSVLTNGLEAAMAVGAMRKIQEGAAIPSKMAMENVGLPAWVNANGAPGGFNLSDLLNGAPAATPPGADGFARHLTAMQQRVQPGILSKVWQGLAMVPGRQEIISGLRPGATIAGSGGRPSLHGIGRAADIGALARKDGGSAASEAMGDKIAAVFRSGVIPGVSEVLWKTMQGGNHFDHVHVGFRHQGGPVGVPGLKVGGEIQYDNTIANLHKNEKVLTAPLSKQLERGIGNLDAGGGVKYDITMDLRGAYIKEEIDIERAVNRAIEKKESKMGRKRVIKD